jgi:PAS domain S-box-containing protein
LKRAPRQPSRPSLPGGNQPGRARHSGRAAAAPTDDRAPGVTRPTRATPGGPSRKLAKLRARLADAEEALRAISAGEVDALVTVGKNGPQVFTLEGADHAYRVLIESMHEGALTLTTNTTILYANQCFARMVQCPLEQVTGSSFRRFLSPEDWAALEPLVQRPQKSGAKIQVLLDAGNGTHLPVQISIRPLPKTHSKGATLTMVVADMTQARQIEELLRSQRGQAEAALRASEAKLALAFASMTEAIFIADASGRLTDFNDEFVRYHRFKNRDECSRTIADCPKYLEAYFADGTPAPPEQWAMARALRGETASNVEYRLCRKETGETWWGSYSFGPIQDKDGGFAGAVVSCRDITERKALEQEKAEALRLLDTLLTHAPVGFAFFDRDLRFVRINKRLAEFNGLTIAAHLGKTVAEILPTFAPALKEMAAHILATGQPALDHKFTGETASAPGVARYWNASWSPVHDERGEIIGFGAVVDEITERKQAEDALRESEERFRSIAENQSEGLLLFDPQGNLLFENAASLRIHDSSIADLRIRQEEDYSGIWQVWDEGGQALPMDQWPASRALRGERFESQVLHARRLDTGLEFDASYNGCPIYDASGKLTLACITVRDITEQRKAEKALAASRTQLQDIIDGTPAIVYAFDLEARFVLANATLAELVNSTPEQMIGKRRHELMPKQDAEWHDANDRQVLASGRMLELEEHSEINGRSITWLTAKFPLRDAQGEIYAVAGISSDISERKRAEAAVQASEAKLREQFGRLALLEQITRAISSHLDFQHILQVVTNNLEDNLPVDFCCVCLFDEQARKFAVAQVGPKSAPLALELAMPEHTVILLDCVALAQVALGELSYLPDVREMAFPFPQRLAKGGLRSLVLAPLLLEGKAIGFLMVARHEARGFLEGECEFLKQLSEHVALAYHQAKLHTLTANGLRCFAPRRSRSPCNGSACARWARWPAASPTTSATRFRP